MGLREEGNTLARLMRVTSSAPSHPRRQHWKWFGSVPTLLVVFATMTNAGAVTVEPHASVRGRWAPASHAHISPFPVGTKDSADPSREGPPNATALAGFHRVYVSDFPGRSLSHAWELFTGVPGGDPGGQFAASHVTVSGGLLHLNAWRDPMYQGRWVTGGLCQCGITQSYGAYFVRSRITGGGANEVQLLWPASDTWPPEIDFNESLGYQSRTTASIHFGAANHVQQLSVKRNLLLWHTWGVIWTPDSITFVVDGRPWHVIRNPADIPKVRMRLDLEQRTMCSRHAQCPARPVSMEVDWVAVYGMDSTAATTTTSAPRS